MNPDETQSDDDRLPCVDDLCTGILGPDGRCGTCGREGSGVVPHDAGSERAADESASDAAVEAVEASEGEGESDDAVERDEDADRDRVPCADDLCTGILGPDGHCGTCGRAG